MGRVNGAQVSSPPARNNDEFENPFADATSDVDEPDQPVQGHAANNMVTQGGVATNSAQADAARRRRSPLERMVAQVLRAPDTMSQEDLAREVEARLRELEQIQTDGTRQQVITERALAHADILKKKVVALKRKLVEIALSVDED